MRVFPPQQSVPVAAPSPQPSPRGRGSSGVGRRAVLALPLLAGPALACQRTRVAEVPLRLVEGYPLVPALLMGQPVSLLLDTGAQGMLVTPAMADALGLPLNGLTRVFGTGGSQQARVVRLPGLRLGGAAMTEQLAPVLPLPIDLAVSPPLAGLLGASLLARFDLDLDVPGGRMVLWAPGDCPPPGGTTLPLEVSRAGEAFVPVRVNGQPMLALLDTGSRATILSQAAAKRLGIAMPSSANTAPGVDGNPIPIGHTRVRLRLGDEPEADVPVSVAPLQLDRGDMLLGLDQLGRRALWIGYAAGVAVFAR